MVLFWEVTYDLFNLGAKTFPLVQMVLFFLNMEIYHSLKTLLR